MFADPADLAHDARNALTGALGRVQLIRRQAERGNLDLALAHASLAEAEARLRRLTELIDALEDAAVAASPGADRVAALSAA